MDILDNMGVRKLSAKVVFFFLLFVQMFGNVFPNQYYDFAEVKTLGFFNNVGVPDNTKVIQV